MTSKAPYDTTLVELPAEVLGWALPRRIDAMLERLSAYDFLAALILAESVLNDVPDHGLGAVCRAEALSVLRSFLEGPLSLARWDTDGLDADKSALVARAEGETPNALMPARGPGYVFALRTLHDLVRLGFFEARGATFLEHPTGAPAPSADSPHPAPRIEEHANAAAVVELDRALAWHPGECFAIGRREEIDFGGLWREHDGCKDIYPLAVGGPADMTRRERHLVTYARATVPELYVELPEASEASIASSHVLYVVIGPPGKSPQ